ncbi:MAG: hypothetical protein AAB600_00195 [Patescibacteria group bacterium]
MHTPKKSIIAKQAKAYLYEKQLDHIVYKLYGITPEEIEVVDSNNE